MNKLIIFAVVLMIVILISFIQSEKPEEDDNNTRLLITGPGEVRIFYDIDSYNSWMNETTNRSWDGRILEEDLE